MKRQHRKDTNRAPKSRQKRLMSAITPKPRDGIELRDVLAYCPTWAPGETSRILEVHYHPAIAPKCPVMCKVKVVRCADLTWALRCPICGLECYDLGETRRGLGCGDCIRWLEPATSRRESKEKKAA